MPQNPLASTIGKTPAGAQSTARFDTVYNLMVSDGGLLTVLDITAAAVIKASAGRVNQVLVSWTTAPTGGVITLNDCATTGTAAASNVIFSTTYSQLVLGGGNILYLQFPFFTGLVLSAVPTGGSGFQVAVSYS